MDTLSYRTVSANKETVNKEWVLIDAQDQVVGRLSSIAAKFLRGKYKTNFTPHVDCGDNVIIVNAEKIKFTGKNQMPKGVVKTSLVTPRQPLELKLENITNKKTLSDKAKVRLGSSVATTRNSSMPK